MAQNEGKLSPGPKLASDQQLEQLAHADPAVARLSRVSVRDVAGGLVGCNCKACTRQRALSGPDLADCSQ